jgi:site-specific recombinase XerD
LAPIAETALGGSENMEVMSVAYLRQRSGGRFFLLIYWKGKKHQKGLGTTDPAAAARIKLEVEEQLRRIRSGDSLKATQLLYEGFSITDVLFGCPEIDKKLASEPEANSLTLRALSDSYLEYQLPTVGPDERYNSTARFKKLCEFFENDRLVMSITDSSLTAYHAHRMGDGLNGTSVQKEFGSLKAAISWAIKTEKIPQSPIKVWPHVKVSRLRRFEWKSDIDRMIDSQTFEHPDEKQIFLREISARMVLTTNDMRSLIKLANEKMPELVVPLTTVCATGMRRKEMVLLRKEDFDPQRCTLLITSRKQSRTEEITTRTIVLPENVADSLRCHVADIPLRERSLFPLFSRIDRAYNNRWVECEKNSSGKDRLLKDGRKMVMRNGRGAPMLTERITTTERAKTERAGRLLKLLVRGTDFELMCGWHCLRHSFISACVTKGLTWEQIAEWVGHVSRRTTRLYTHFDLQDSRERIESLGLDLV